MTKPTFNPLKHVAVKSFSVVRIADMDDYLKALLRKEPDEITLHVETKNICNESSRSMAKGIVNKVTQVPISPLLPRTDNLELNNEIKEANKIFNLSWSSCRLTLLHITNIDLTCLNPRGVQLNCKGLHFFQIAMLIFFRSY